MAVLTGAVPSYYLKQLAQELVRRAGEIDFIVNGIVVGSPNSAGQTKAD